MYNYRYFLFTIVIGILLFNDNALYALSCDKSCAIITPEVFQSLNAPKHNNRSNNLARGTHSIRSALGEKIFISGRVLDKCNRPINNAMVQIWHSNSYGLMQDIGEGYLGKIVQNNMENNNSYDTYFGGNGINHTDNLGRYSFITIMPSSDKKYLYAKITSKGAMPFYTVLFFDDNNDNNLLFHMKKSHKKLLMLKNINNRRYEFDFVTPGLGYYSNR